MTIITRTFGPDEIAFTIAVAILLLSLSVLYFTSERRRHD